MYWSSAHSLMKSKIYPFRVGSLASKHNPCHCPCCLLFHHCPCPPHPPWPAGGASRADVGTCAAPACLPSLLDGIVGLINNVEPKQLNIVQTHWVCQYIMILTILFYESEHTMCSSNSYLFVGPAMTL